MNISPFKLYVIYVFSTDYYNHKDCYKVGVTSINDGDVSLMTPNSELLNAAADKRVSEIANTLGVKYKLEHTELSLFYKNGELVSFQDHEVHQVLKRSKINNKIFGDGNTAREWFVASLDTIRNAIKAAKEGRLLLHTDEKSNKLPEISLRTEQLKAIEDTKQVFKKENRMLWNAKMRFGKTLTSLKLIKEQNYNKTIIITHRPVVDNGWFEDYNKIFNSKDNFIYGSKNKGENFESILKLMKSKNIIYFASIQDLRGAETVGGKFDKNEDIFKIDWDLVIIDEAHEGTKTDLGQSVITELTKKNTKRLELSGTPFNLFNDYSEHNIYTWDYVMEQNAKNEWDKINLGIINPYSSLPRMNIYTYNLGELISKFKDNELAFNFKEFFRVNKDEKFIHEKDIISFLNLICVENENTFFPYSNEIYRNNFRHTLWMVPGVREARALSSLLNNHLIFKKFEIVNVSGEGDEEKPIKDALDSVKKAISDNPYTITISCGRLTTGVTVPEWTAVFMLSGSQNTSASSYMQTIFRVQSPAIINNKVKEDCFVFDFAPDRTLKVIAEVANITANKNSTNESKKNILGDFLNFCPVISINGSRMQSYDVDNLLIQLKKVYIDKVVSSGFEDGKLYNNNLLNLNEIDEKAFEKLRAQIGTTTAMPKVKGIDINKQGFNNEDYEVLEQKVKQLKSKSKLTDEDKKRLEELNARKKLRDTAVNILRGISIRMPLILYGANLSDENSEITLDNFTNIVDDISWTEFMPKGVTKEMFNEFTKYYDAEIFQGAGVKIRAMARATDNLRIEERIARITSIFNSFRNPDKETVLTPWRVVNMHLGDCLGGYVFLDEEKKVVEKPTKKDNGEVTKNVFAPNSLVLEINSKSGLYPLYMAFGIFKSKIEAFTSFDNATIEEELTIWSKVITDNIYVICKTPMAVSITKRTLAGFGKTKVNAKYIPDLVNEITNNAEDFIKQIKQGKSFWKSNNNENMKFNVIVGNPPYQEMDGGAQASASPIYNKFVDISKKINPNYFTLIMPSRWYSGGKGLDTFREEMLNDKNISVLHDYLNPNEIFPNTNIRGGICYFLWDSFYDNSISLTNVVTHQDGFEPITKLRSLKSENNDTFIRHSGAISIIDKINLSSNFVSIENHVSSRKPFGIEGFIVKSENFKKNKSNLKEPIICFGKGKIQGYIEKKEIKFNQKWIKNYKVLTPRANNIGTELNDDNLNTFISPPGSVCTESYMVIGAELNLNKYSANSLSKYFTTKFVRLLHSLAKASQDATSKTYKFVPLQDFTENSDIDWSKSVAEIEQQLYKKYNLEEEEIKFIESMIKPME